MKKSLLLLAAFGVMVAFSACHKKNEGKPARVKKEHKTRVHHKRYGEHPGYEMAR